jgi:hypothetical protein
VARICIFCCAASDLNKEDLWPKWLVKLVTQDRPSSIERSVGANGVPVTYEGRWIKGRCVCERCNHGWMRDLENSTKPILAPLICDVPSSVGYVQRLAIATWTLKTAMAFECITGAANPNHTSDDGFYSHAQRKHMLDWRTPPPDTSVWIGRYEPEFSLWIQNDRVSNPQPVGVLDAGSVTTFAASRLVIQAVTVRRSEGTEANSRPIRNDKSAWALLSFQSGLTVTARFVGPHSKP